MQTNNSVGQLDEPIVIHGVEKVMVVDGVGGSLLKKFGRKIVVVVKVCQNGPSLCSLLNKGMEG